MTTLLAIDQGTTSSRAIVFDADGRPVADAQAEFPQIYPADGWVEHDPEAIWRSVLATGRAAVDAAASAGRTPAALGVANQRETVVVWDRTTGEPIHNAIVWQDRRTAKACEALEAAGAGDEVARKTGLLLDPYFSATKFAWILDAVPGARERAERGELAGGTIDTFLVWRLTNGATHATDPSNVCRTSLYDIDLGDWDEGLCKLFRVPRVMLPEIRDTAGDFGEAAAAHFGRALPIRAVAGDQQAASFGQGCFAPGSMKATYGTGCFALVNTGGVIVRSRNRLLSTVAWRLGGETTYALEGSIFIAGAAVQWLRDGVGLLASSAETAERAARAAADARVVMVPAFTGMGAPHWSADARAAVFGMTRATGPDELARAALEGVVYQTADLFEAMRRDGVSPESLRIDGGMAANDWFVQRLADILDLEVRRPPVLETTALGAAFLAGLGAGVFTSPQDVAARLAGTDAFAPRMRPEDRAARLTRWRACVDAVLAVARAESEIAAG